jgi:hypothetical protein
MYWTGAGPWRNFSALPGQKGQAHNVVQVGDILQKFGDLTFRPQ